MDLLPVLPTLEGIFLLLLLAEEAMGGNAESAPCSSGHSLYLASFLPQLD